MTCPACNHKHQGPSLAFICIGCPCLETPGKAEWLAKRREAPKVVKAVLIPGTSRAHLAGIRSRLAEDEEECDGEVVETSTCVALCGERLPSSSALGGLHETYCQTCVARLGAKEITP